MLNGFLFLVYYELSCSKSKREEVFIPKPRAKDLIVQIVVFIAPRSILVICGNDTSDRLANSSWDIFFPSRTFFKCWPNFIKYSLSLV